MDEINQLDVFESSLSFMLMFTVKQSRNFFQKKKIFQL